MNGGMERAPHPPLCELSDPASCRARRRGSPRSSGYRTTSTRADRSTISSAARTRARAR